MTLVDIALVRKHLRVDWSDEDTEIEVYQAAAETIVTEYLDRKVLETEATIPGPEDEGYDATAMLVTPPIVAAILLVTNDLFDMRTTPEKNEGEAVLSPVVRRLLAPYRVWRQFEETV